MSLSESKDRPLTYYKICQEIISKENKRNTIDKENSYTLFNVISALVANGINPLTDEKWIKGENTVLDALLKYKESNYFIYNDARANSVKYKDKAIERAFIALTDLQRMKSSYKDVQKAISYKKTIGNGLYRVRNYLTTTEKRKNRSLKEVDVFYTWQEALAINHTSSELEKDYIDIQEKLKLNSKDNILSLSQDIMGIIGSGQVLSKLEKDYVGELLALQNENGEFKEEGKKANVNKQSNAIIALDIAGKEYNVEGAIKSLISMADVNNFGSVEKTF